MISMVDFLVAIERRKDEIAQAEQYRLARQIPRHNSSLTKRYQHLLARLGELLVAWGSQLQTRFATESNTTQSDCI